MRSSDLLIVGLAAVTLILGSISTPATAQGGVAELKAQWESRAKSNAGEVPMAAASDSSLSSEAVPPEPTLANPLGDGPQVTATLVAWLSSQAEATVEELEAIAQQNAESSKFSVVNYLRYLELYDNLRILAAKSYDELRWVQRKANVFVTVYKAAYEVVENYLKDQHQRLLTLERKEPAGKQITVDKNWVELFESIRYIATHAPPSLAESAKVYIQFSPNDTNDKMRSMRYQAKTNAFSR